MRLLPRTLPSLRHPLSPVLLLAAAALLTALLPGRVGAQSIPIKTVPVAEGNQFMLFPSQNRSMGGVSVALDDPLHDPFVNPAKGMNLTNTQFSATPTYYGFASGNERVDDGSGRTLPLSALGRRGRFFGGAALAWQELVLPEAGDFGWRSAPDDFDVDRTQDNLYLFGTGGLQIPGTHVSVGVSVLGARLNGIEGVRMLYLRGNQVDQSGWMSSYRLGLYWRDPASRHTAEATLLHHRLDMEHAMMNWTRTGASTGFIAGPPGRWEAHSEYDRTRGWALQLGYQYALSGGWRLGAQATGDAKQHPKIPNYDLMQIPRDPGTSQAYDISVGASREVGAATFGLDVFYQPIWSHTWANALGITETAGEAPLAPGEKTVDNRFRFHNAGLRAGLRRATDRYHVALGMSAHRISYVLDQQDFVEASTRTQSENWTEWTLTGGFGINFPEFQIRYEGALTLGTGQPTTTQRPVFFAEQANFARAGGADFLVAPNGALSLDETKVLTHQVTIAVPLSRSK